MENLNYIENQSLNRSDLFYSEESDEMFSDFHEYSKDSRAVTLLREAEGLIEELLELGYKPVFTVPRKYIDNVLKNGLVPHTTYIKSSSKSESKIVAGTIGIPPFQAKNEEARFYAILEDTDSFFQLGLRPRITGRNAKGKRGTFNGVIATLKAIPLDKLRIIDSKNMKQIYPETNTDQDINTKKISSKIRKKLRLVA